ncbi:MAG: DUF6050 family protein [Acetivibrio ethanolgignens]
MYDGELKKSIIRVTLIMVWAWLMHYFYIVEGHFDVFRMWMLIGFPFGIHRVHLWLIPRNFDLGGTVGICAINIVTGCIIGGFVVIGHIVKLIYCGFYKAKRL